jgi:hypothetical protein
MLGNLGEVFLRLRQAGLKLKAKKCNLFAKRVSYFGHIISQDGIATDPEKVKAVADGQFQVISQKFVRFLDFAAIIGASFAILPL